MDAGERELRKSACGRGIHAGIGRLQLWACSQRREQRRRDHPVA